MLIFHSLTSRISSKLRLLCTSASYIRRGQYHIGPNGRQVFYPFKGYKTMGCHHCCQCFVCSCACALSRVLIASSWRARQCLLLCLVKSVPCCHAWQNEHCCMCRAKLGWFFVPQQRDFSVLCSFNWDGLVALINSHTWLPRFDSGHEHRTNEWVCRAQTAARGTHTQSVPSFRCFNPFWASDVFMA
jgi:hypothetical protein